MQTDYCIQGLKAAVCGVVVSLLCALGLAFILRFFPMEERVLTLTAQSLKAMSLLLGCALFIKSEGGWRKGLLAGLLFALLSYLSFSAVGGFAWSWKILFDLAMGLGVGVLSGIAAVNLKKA